MIARENHGWSWVAGLLYTAAFLVALAAILGPGPVGQAGPEIRPKAVSSEASREAVLMQALEENNWNRTRTAEALGSISRTTLIGKMKRLGLFTDSRGPT